jgi:hypothetical protein
MQNFKTFLKEDKLSNDEVKAIVDGWNTTIDKIRRTTNPSAKFFTDYQIRSGQIGHTASTLRISETMLDEKGELSAPFSFCNNLDIIAHGLRSFKNFPVIVKGESPSQWSVMTPATTKYHKITSLEGFPRYIRKGMVDFAQDRYFDLSFSNVHKHIDTLYGSVNIIEIYNGPLLGFFLVKKLQKINFDLATTGLMRDLEHQLYLLLNKHTDLLDAKEILMSKGFKEFAKL